MKRGMLLMKIHAQTQDGKTAMHCKSVGENRMKNIVRVSLTIVKKQARIKLFESPSVGNGQTKAREGQGNVAKER
jgi:hypothetical protein